MLNSINVQGRLVRDPELRYTNSGIAVASFTIACERDYVTQTGAQRETDFIDCVIWRQSAEFVNKYFHKGDMILATGRLQFRHWEDKDGNSRRNAEVMCDHAYFSGSKRDGSQGKEQRGEEDDFVEVVSGGGELPF